MHAAALSILRECPALKVFVSDSMAQLARNLLNANGRRLCVECKGWRLSGRVWLGA